jgi:hypothetical protein
MTEVNSRQIQRLADDVRAKILAEAEVISRSKGEILIRIFRRNDGFDIKLKPEL